MAEVAPAWMNEILKPLVEILAGLPFGRARFYRHPGAPLPAPAPQPAHRSDRPHGAVLLGWAPSPPSCPISEDALHSVPRSYREASLALGATHWQTIWGVTLPAARTGVTTAVMLGIGRVIGETMTVMMVTGNAPVLASGLNAIISPVRTMTATIASEMGEVANGSTHYQVLFLIGIILFLFSLIVNSVVFAVTSRRLKRNDRLLS